MSTRLKAGNLVSQILAATGSTYRQFDYWCRIGVLSATVADHDAMTRGSGNARQVDAWQVVLIRAYAVMSAIVRGQSVTNGVSLDARFALIPARLAEAFEADPTLTNYWLVVEADSAQIVFGDYPTDGALFIDLSACVSYVREHGEGAA